MDTHYSSLILISMQMREGAYQMTWEPGTMSCITLRSTLHTMMELINQPQMFAGCL